MKHTLNRLIELSAPTKVKLFNVGPNDSTKGVFSYNPELKDKIIENQSKDGRDLLPIDLAHLSLTNSETVAAHKSYGWFQLSIEDDGIYADKIEWTEEGKKLLENREFRFFSPAFETNENNEIVFIDNFALTNEPALRDLQPLVASKLNININKDLNPMSEEEMKELVEDVVLEKLEKLEDKKEDETLPEEIKPEDEKDQLLSDLTAQVDSLKEQNASLMAKLAEYESAAVEAEKEQVLSSLELSDEEKVFFGKLGLDQLKEYSVVRLSKLNAEKAKQREIEQEKQIKLEKDFVNNKGPKAKEVEHVQEFSLKHLPTKEQIQERARKIAASRTM